MPFVVYIFAISAFALGLAEFVPIGLSEVIAGGLGVDVEHAGAAVTWYALGATFAAPVLTALTAAWPRKRVMLTTALVFTLGSAVAAIASSIDTMVVARFVAGLGHGLFLAVASSTAARLAGQQRAGSAVAVIFGGFTIALALGVPVSTYLGGLLDWRLVLGAIAVFGAIGFIGLMLGMREPAQHADEANATSVSSALKAMFHPVLLFAASVTVLGYAGAFAALTYIAPLLTSITGIDTSTVGAFMLMYGVFAAIGNILGGKITDRVGATTASVIVLLGIVASSLGMWLFASSAIMMGALIALLGLFSYAAVPALQARLLAVAAVHAPHAQGVAAGLNIAGFNSGIAVGSYFGGLTISSLGIEYLGIAGAAAGALGLFALMLQRRLGRSAPLPNAPAAAH